MRIIWVGKMSTKGTDQLTSLHYGLHYVKVGHFTLHWRYLPLGYLERIKMQPVTAILTINIIYVFLHLEHPVYFWANAANVPYKYWLDKQGETEATRDQLNHGRQPPPPSDLCHRSPGHLNIAHCNTLEHYHTSWLAENRLVRKMSEDLCAKFLQGIAVKEVHGWWRHSTEYENLLQCGELCLVLAVYLALFSFSSYFLERT